MFEPHLCCCQLDGTSAYAKVGLSVHAFDRNPDRGGMYRWTLRILCLTIHVMTSDGKNLEQAAEAIESLLLQQNSDLSGLTIEVQARRRERIAGVLHEFDLWVSVETVGIFLVECKDWAKPVGKNEIIIFAEKLRATGALGGYVVARSFTADAKAQAKLAKNLRLEIARTELKSLVELPQYHAVFNTIITDLSSVALTVGSQSAPTTRIFVWKGNRLTIDELSHLLLEEALTERMSIEPTASKPNGKYRLEFRKERKFDVAEIMCGLSLVRSASLHLVFDVEVEHPLLVWQFAIAERGVAVKYLTTRPEGTIEATFTRTAKNVSLPGQ